MKIKPKNKHDLEVLKFVYYAGCFASSSALLLVFILFDIVTDLVGLEKDVLLIDYLFMLLTSVVLGISLLIRIKKLKRK